MVERSKNSVYE